MKMKLKLMLCICAFVLALTGSSAFAATKVTKPARPTITLVGSAETGMKVKWKKVSGATKYEVARASGINGTRFSVIGSTSKNYFIDKKAAPGKIYIYKVRAVKTKNGKTVKGKYCKRGWINMYLPQVTNAQAVKEGDSYSVTWNRVKGATGYEIQYTDNHIMSEYDEKTSVTDTCDNVVLNIPGDRPVNLRIRAIYDDEFYTYGPWSHILVIGHGGSSIILKKPVIYLYPEDGDLDVSVGLDLAGDFTCVYPSFDEASTWNVTASPDGTIKKDDKTYRYLYWEGEGGLVPDMSNADCVSGSDTASYLESTLEILGLNDAERNDFITYWLPQMEKNPYNLISFQTENYTDVAKLNVSPQPDTMIRVYMCWQAIDEPVETAAMMPQSPERTGFTVVEWGGSEL